MSRRSQDYKKTIVVTIVEALVKIIPQYNNPIMEINHLAPQNLSTIAETLTIMQTIIRKLLQSAIPHPLHRRRNRIIQIINLVTNLKKL